MKLPFALAFGALLALPASAFTLDFSGNLGATVPPSLVVNVPGYGDVQFDAGFSSALEVGDSFKNDDGSAAISLEFVEGESVNVTFLALQPLNVDFEFAGVSSGEAFQTFQTGSNSYLVALQGSGDGAGILSVSFNQVPEPSTAMLGLIGALALLRRRR